MEVLKSGQPCCCYVKVHAGYLHVAALVHAALTSFLFSYIVIKLVENEQADKSLKCLGS